jgi:hypothetical protein
VSGEYASDINACNLSDRLMPLSQITPKNTLIFTNLYFIVCFWARSQNCEKQLLASSCLPVCPSVLPSVHMEQFGFNWKNFCVILYFRIFRKSVQKIQVSLKSDEKKGCHVTTNTHFDPISLSYSENEKCFRQFYVCSWVRAS